MKTTTELFKLAPLMLALVVTGCNRQPTADAAAAGNETALINAPAEREPVVEPPPVCATCGIVRSVDAVQVEGEGTGVGAVIGGIVGGLAGNQIGGGSGRKIATVAGVVGGAVAGNTIEKRRNAESWYDVVIDMEDGSVQRLTVADTGGIGVGSRVRVQGDEISLR